MDPRNLNQSSIRAAITVAAAVVIGLTMIGCLLGWLAPSLAGNTRPHPALTGTVGNAVSILVTNLRVLAIPFLLAGLGLGRSRTGRLVGDIALGLLTAASTLLVGVQLGRWQSQLIPFIPQLPIEWAALAVSLSAWVLVRDRSRGHRQLLILAMVAVALVVVAAGVETWGTPHRALSRVRTGQVAHSSREIGFPVGDGSGFRSGFCATSGLGLQGHSFPFPHIVRFRPASVGGADRTHNHHRPPQEGSPT
jgi:hypothetical protein